MINSIQQFGVNGVNNLTNIFGSYTEDMTKIAEMVYGVTDEVTKLGCSIIAEEWESYDELLRKRKELRKGWYIVRKDETSLITSLGEVVYHKTLFKNVATGESCYLLDQLMGLEHHARITEDAEARILAEASESSYRKGGANASISGDAISKEAVMNKLHSLEFPTLKADEKKELKTLYIDADEDHVSLQYLEQKGDIKKPRINTVMPRIVYVYEGVDTDDEGRPKLINTKYFGGVYDGPEAINKLWTEVLDYLNEAYDIEKIDRIYINGDGATWIRTGEKIIPRSKFALDKYHMHKYIIAATSHLEDSTDDARSEIYRAIHKKKKWMAEEVFEKIIAVTDKETKCKAVEHAKAYILGNWSGIMLSMKSHDTNVRCSAEGHVSHVYADRMSSRPLGWCRTGADKMSRLRIYRQNQGDMLELVRFQKKEMKQAAGAEEVIYTATDMIRMENANRKRLGVMADMPIYSIPYPQIKKIAALKNHIEYQFTDTSCIVFMYGHDIEVGFLKINPERVPVVTSESIVNSEIRQEEKTYEVFSLCRNKYALVVESGAYEMENCNLVLYGNAYIARQQKNTVSALSSDEIFEWLKKLNRPITFHNAEIDKQSVIIFEHDENTNTWY